ncbi:hypothetical protein J6590_057761 [Homalodisca vitripennis]|nr:hypothetical protein J6590_057761 [Homalodisca vitripennis]
MTSLCLLSSFTAVPHPRVRGVISNSYLEARNPFVKGLWSLGVSFSIVCLFVSLCQGYGLNHAPSRHRESSMRSLFVINMNSDLQSHVCVETQNPYMSSFVATEALPRTVVWTATFPQTNPRIVYSTFRIEYHCSGRNEL